MVNQKNKQTFSPPRVGEVLWRTRPNAMCILTSPVQSVQLILKSTIVLHICFIYVNIFPL